jgi:hypothetical protein
MDRNLRGRSGDADFGYLSRLNVLVAFLAGATLSA